MLIALLATRRPEPSEGPPPNRWSHFKISRVQYPM
jgi:hypothetical protein